MLMILVNWVYILITTFCLGYALSLAAGKLFSYRLKGMDSILMAGLACATVYAQIFSLFSGVGIPANVLLLVFCGVMILLFHRQMWMDIRRAWKDKSRLYHVLVPVLLLVWAYCTSRGYMVPDTQLYHSQSIRWIEEYGVVPGQAILNTRFAYNSSVFALSALYSLKFVFGQSMHAVNGWIGFLLSVTVLDVMRGRKKFRLSDFANVAAIYYLTTICDEVIGPSSDYASMCLAFFILIKWIRLSELPKEEQKTAPYALLCVLAVYTLTLKVTAGLILLLLIRPAYELLRDRKWKEILLYLLMGLITAAPWLIRNVLISGWLLYPFPALDLFDVSWKQDVEIVMVDAAAIKTWGRALYDSSKVNLPVWEWFGGWFSSVLSLMEKGIILADIAAILFWIPSVAVMFVKRKWDQCHLHLIIFAVVCSYLYWQLSAPLPRYGYVYMLLLPALVFGRLVLALGRDGILRIVLGAYGVYKIYAVAAYMYSCSWYPAYIRQVDYYSAEGEVFVREVDGVSFYRSETEPLGYAHFPGESALKEFTLRGEGIEDGFEWLRIE